MLVVLLSTLAQAAPCTPAPIEGASLDPAGATAMVIRGVEGAVAVSSGEGGAVTAQGSACREVTVKLARKGNVIEATVKGARQANLQLEITVPRTLQSLSVQDQAGPLTVSGVQARLAVVSSTGPVEVQGGEALRVAYVTGPVQVEGVKGDVAVDMVTGTVKALDIGGDVLVDNVTGPVTVDDVDGGLAVRGGSGPVNQSNVRGGVQLP